MLNFKLHSRFAIAGIVLLSPASLMVSRSDGTEPTTQISVTDIGEKVTLVGRLGEPLGKMMKIKGTWHLPDDNDKDSSIRFAVSQVNDRKLAKSVEFNIALVDVVSPTGKDLLPARVDQESLDGATWTIRGFENGSFDAIPLEYWLESGMRGPPGRPYYRRTFTSQFVGVLQSK